VANNQRASSRRSDAIFQVPSGEDLATFESYPAAQELVNQLVTNGVPAKALSIVGSDVTVVERVTGRVGYGRAALSSAISGSWLGALAGLVVIIINPVDVITPLAAGVLIGAGAGMVIGMLVYTLSPGPKRLYRSMQQVIARSYRVVVESAAHEAARKAMAEGES